MDAEGRGVRRLTHHSADDRLGGWAPGGELLFDTGRTFVQVEWEAEMHAVPATGGTPDRLLDAVGFAPVALTSYPEDGVRYFGVGADGGTVAFERSGSLWVMEEGGEPRRLEVRIPQDDHFLSVERRTFRERASEYAVSPDGERVALVVRGEVFLVENDAEGGRTVRLTENPSRERDVAWLGDSTLVLASDRDGDYDLYRLESSDPDTADLY